MRLVTHYDISYIYSDELHPLRFNGKYKRDYYI